MYSGWLGDPEPSTAPIKQEDELIDALKFIKRRIKLKQDESEENNSSLNKSSQEDFDHIVEIVNRLCK